MNRREFITLLGGAGAMWPLAARAQQAERVRRIGVLLPATSDDPEYQARVGAFLQALALLGWTLGRNVRIDTRWAGADAASIRRHAVVAPDVILAMGGSTVGPLLQATRTVPIVFPAAVDPVGSGFVDSLARPGGNATGFMGFEYSLGGKWLELLKEIAPGVRRVAVLRDAANPSGNALFGVIQAAAPSLRVEVNPVNMRDAGEIERPLRGDRPHEKNSGPPTDAGATNFVRSTQAHSGLQCPELAQLRPQIVPWSTLCRADWVRNDPVLTTRG